MPTLADTIVRDLRAEDWPQVASIYAEGIRTGNATRLGELAGVWRDVLLLERRSEEIG